MAKKTTSKTAAKKQAKKLSQIEAAIKVLTTRRKAMTCKEMVEAMAAKKFWTSPEGKTPEATLYASIIRDIKKGDKARFKKVAPGKFALNRKRK